MQIKFKYLVVAFGILTVISCTPKSWRYGNIVDHGKDPYEQGIVLSIPENAPSIERRYRLLYDIMPSVLEQGDQAHEGIDLSGGKGDTILAEAKAKFSQKFSR